MGVITLQKPILYIMPREQQQAFLSHMKDNFEPCQLMSLEEFRKHFYFDYDEQSVYALCQEYQLKPSLAKMYLNQFYYMDHCNFSNEKIADLKQKKTFIENQNLLKRDEFFRVYLKKYRIIVKGYDPLDEFDLTMFQEISAYTEVTIVPCTIRNKEYVVHTFSHIAQEVSYIAEQILVLYQQKVPFSKIHLANVKEEYYETLTRIFQLYHIPIAPLEKESLLGTYCGKMLLSYLKECDHLSELVTMLQEKMKDSGSFDLVISILNRYYWYQGSCEHLLPMILEDLKTTYLPIVHHQDEVKISSIFGSFDEDEYVFVLGLRDGAIPQVYQDTDFLNDKEKAQLHLDITETKNQKMRRKTLAALSNLPNATFSYSAQSSFEEFSVSNLLDEMNVSFQEEELPSTISSKIYFDLELGKQLDRYLKYGKLEDSLSKLYWSHPSIAYRTYQNQFTKISKEHLFAYLNHKLTLSYSSLDQYYRCKFRYYISSILKLNIEEERFSQKLGTLFHAVLSQCFQPDFDFDSVFTKEMKPFQWDQKEHFFLVKLKEELKFIIQTLYEQKRKTSFTDSFYEKRITLDQKRSLDIRFTGIIDRMDYLSENGITYVMIVDYKTGHPNLDLGLCEYGIGMQLPIYLYLVKKSGLFGTVRFAGFYLQKILNSELSIVPGKSYIDLKKDTLRLAGYTSRDYDVIEKIDIDFQEKSYIQGMKLSKNGFYPYTKVLSDEKMEYYISLVNRKIEEAIQKIEAADFEIDPKVIDMQNVGCEFCPYRDLCYKTPRDYIYIETKGGEEDADMDARAATSN